jgi:hypothetical protein
MLKNKPSEKPAWSRQHAKLYFMFNSERFPVSSVDFHQTARRYMPEDSRRCESLSYGGFRNTFRETGKLNWVNISEADHGGRAVKGMNCLRSLERWNRGFESHSKAWMSVYVYSVFVLLYV